MFRPPVAPGHAGFIRQNQGLDPNVFPRGDGSTLFGGQIEPDVSVQAVLVAGVAKGHRSAARLRQVAYPERGEAPRLCGRCKLLHKGYQGRVAPIAVPGQPHRLPTGTVRRQGHRASHTTKRWSADDPRRPWCRSRHGGPRRGATVRRVGLDRRRRNRGFRSAVVLLPRRRKRNATGGEEQGEQSCCGSDQNRRSYTVTTSPGCNRASRLARYSTGRPSGLMRVIET